MENKINFKRLMIFLIASIMLLSIIGLLPTTIANNDVKNNYLFMDITPNMKTTITMNSPPMLPLYNSDALVAGADYLVKCQADITEDNAGNGPDGSETPEDPDDGGWDWSSTIFTHSTSGSPTNIYGATALGLYYAYLETGDTSYFTAMTDCANQLITDDTTYRTASDIIFLLRYQDLPGATASIYETSAKNKFDGRISFYGSAQALAEYIRDVRAASYPNGIIAWDIGAWAKAAQMLHLKYPGQGYHVASMDIAEVIYQDSFMGNPGYFDIYADQGYDPTYTNKNYWWYNLGITGLIDAFYYSNTHTGQIPTLIGILQAGQCNSGAFSDAYGGNTGDEDWQATAYAMRTLGIYDQTTYQTEINDGFCYLVATQDPVSGGWVYGSGNHYPEVGGECLAACYFGYGPVKNLDTGETFCCIQDAIDDAETLDTHTIQVSAGYYDGGITIDKSLTIIGAGKAQTIINTSSSPVITVSADDVTIQDLGITDSPYMVEGISVVSPATSGLTVDNVAFTDLGAGTGLNAYGIFIHNGFMDLSVLDCDFSSVSHSTYYRTIGIFAPNNLDLSNFEVRDSTFTTIWTGIYLRSAINGFDVMDNIFQNQQLSDTGGCAAGIYIGDGSDYNFDIQNIEIADNTFTNFNRGVYVWNYANDAIIGSFDVHDNTFTDSIWSSPVRILIGLGDDEGVAYAGPITIDNNDFTQTLDVGGNVALIDFRTYCSPASCDIAIINNDMTFSGGAYSYGMYGIKFSAWYGPFTNTLIENNNLNGGNTGGAGTIPSSGIVIDHYSSSEWPSDILDIDIICNEITRFDNGISIFDQDSSQYGNLTTGSMVNTNCNIITGNNLYGIRNDNGIIIDATCNCWGHPSGPSGEGPGTGDAVTGVFFDPWVGKPLADTGGPYIQIDDPVIYFDGSGSGIPCDCDCIDSCESILQYLWDFGDGTNSTEENPVHTYAGPGTYTVSLKVTICCNGIFSTNTTTSYVEIIYPVKANANGPYEGVVGDNIEFTGEGYDGTAPYEYYWAFGDGAFSPQQNPMHDYDAAGEYHAYLKVTDDTGGYDIDEFDVFIFSAETVVADIGGYYIGDIDETITLNGNAMGGVQPYTFAWDLDGDGQYDDATDSTVLKSWTTSGTYTISLKVTDNTGQSDTDTTQVSIASNAPFTPSKPYGPTSGAAGKEYTYTTKAVDPNNDKVYYKWSFGDGETEWLGPFDSGETIEITHVWEEQGSHIIKVKAKDTTGEESDWSEPLSVSMPRNKEIRPIFDLLQKIIERLIDRFPILDWFF